MPFKKAGKVVALLIYICLSIGIIFCVISLPYADIFAHQWDLANFHGVKFVFGTSLIVVAVIAMNKFKTITKEYKKLYLLGIALFCVYFFLLMAYIHVPQFTSDEFDNLVGGMVVAGGGDIYSAFTSQHMPLTYYICAVYHILGAVTLSEYRMCMYGTLALLWVCMYFRYSPKTGKTVMVLFPIIYIAMEYVSLDSNNYILGATLLSDQFQSQGLVILFLEFYLYYTDRCIEWDRCFWVSLAILLSFGTAFTSAFPIILIFAAVIFLEIQYGIQKGCVTKISFWDKRLFRLLLCVVMPFVILCIWYFVTGNLWNAIKGVYLINAEVYPHYSVDNYGSSALSVFLSPFLKLPDVGIGIVSGLVPNQVVLLFVFDILFFLECCMRRKPILGFVGIYFALLCASRVITSNLSGFHALPFWAASIMLMLICLSDCAVAAGARFHNVHASTIVGTAVSIAVLLWMLAPYCSQAVAYWKQPLSRNDFVVENLKGTVAYYVDLITEDGEYIEDNTASNIYVLTDNVPASCSCFTPWMYEAYREEVFQDTENKKPRVIFLPNEIVTWGYRASDYASDYYAYVKEHYTELTECKGLYIINDYYAEAEDLVYQMQ